MKMNVAGALLCKIVFIAKQTVCCSLKMSWFAGQSTQPNLQIGHHLVPTNSVVTISCDTDVSTISGETKALQQEFSKRSQ